MIRFFEILPGTLTWLTLILMILLAWLIPLPIAIFIIVFELYWLLRLIYYHFCLRFSFNELKINLKNNWLEKLKNTDAHWQNIYHLIILPMYKEPDELIRKSFQTLIQSNYPKKDKFIVVLAIEESAGAPAQETAKKIKEEFAQGFFKFLITIHPKNLPGEITGKGSNAAWAGKTIKKEVIDHLKIPYQNIIVSTFDIDTQVPPEYFSRLTYVFLTTKDSQHSSYQPIPLFVNNIYDTPIFSRIMAFFPTFWQMMQQPRAEKLITFSSQALPFQALVDVNFWTTDHVSEDSLIFWQCYSRYNGNWRTIPLFYPVSMDATNAPTFWQSIKNLYKQQRRWGWGAENIPFMFDKFRKNKNISLKKKVFWLLTFLEGFYSWATAPFLIFFLGWLPIILGGIKFNTSIISYNLPIITGWLLLFLNIGIATSAILSMILLPPKPPWFKKHHYIIYILQWILTPLNLLIFSALPALEAQTRLMLGGKFRLGFWATPKGEKRKNYSK